MTARTEDGTLVVRASARRQLPTLLVLVGFLSFYVVGGATGLLPTVLVVIGIVGFGGILALGGYGLLVARRSPWELRLDRAGVTVRGRATVPWSDVAEVRVTGLRPRWFFLTSLGYRVVSFVPRPGVDLPPLPMAEGTWPTGPRQTALQRRAYGTRLIVFTSAVDVRARDLAAAVRRLSDVPVRD